MTSGRMMGSELTLTNPFVKFIRNVQKLRNFRRIPDGSGSVNGCDSMSFVNTILPLYNHSNTSLPSVKWLGF